LDAILWGGVLRAAQVLSQAAPTLIIGLLVAAVFQRILGKAGTQRLFAVGSWRSLPQAWLLGMLLPVCGLGAIPIMLQLRRSGLPAGTILAFGLSAPLFNPISLLYGLTVAKPLAVITFSLCSLAIVTLLGVLWQRLHGGLIVDQPAPPESPPGWRRMVLVAVEASRMLTGPTPLLVLAAAGGAGVLSMLLPGTALQRAAQAADPLAPITMAAVATLAFTTPMLAMMQLASMFQHGNSIGAGFCLLILGAGVNLGTLLWSRSAYGWSVTLGWLGSLLLIVVALGYGLNQPLAPRGVQAADHTHAFDHYCRPFAAGSPDALQRAWRKWSEDLRPEESVGMLLAGVLLATALGLKRLDPGLRLEAWLLRAPAREAQKDIYLPDWVLTFLTLGALVAASIFSCFLYYPPASQLLEDMQTVHAEIFTTATVRDREAARYWIPAQRDLLHKLGVGKLLRGEPLSRFQQMHVRVLLGKLELLDHELEEEPPDADHIADARRDYNEAHQRFRRALQATSR
jgi:uncharacterized protein